MGSAAKERTKDHPLHAAAEQQDGWSSGKEWDYKAEGWGIESCPVQTFLLLLFLPVNTM